MDRFFCCVYLCQPDIFEKLFKECYNDAPPSDPEVRVVTLGAEDYAVVVTKRVAVRYEFLVIGGFYDVAVGVQWVHEGAEHGCLRALVLYEPPKEESLVRQFLDLSGVRYAWLGESYKQWSAQRSCEAVGGGL